MSYVELKHHDPHNLAATRRSLGESLPPEFGINVQIVPTESKTQHLGLFFTAQATRDNKHPFALPSVHADETHAIRATGSGHRNDDWEAYVGNVGRQFVFADSDPAISKGTEQNFVIVVAVVNENNKESGGSKVKIGEDDVISVDGGEPWGTGEYILTISNLYDVDGFSVQFELPFR